ncbi:hypothetical protein ACNFJN_07790 [Xenorhabdus budapestensis]|uniref:Uncharacterized protein n=1 Tax=Xenorhabdus budapestensis TaxID=290110 RepID=A0ABX7VND8_XENBU|nr:hypothetical protein [Xenorhabdus budapestensis]QTL41187.1 hypothetical protein HGO23_07710 [Xenorhabdus budapestensis]
MAHNLLLLWDNVIMIMIVGVGWTEVNHLRLKKTVLHVLCFKLQLCWLHLEVD